MIGMRHIFLKLWGGGLLLLCLMTWVPSPVLAQSDDLPAVCADATAVTPEECGALVALYNATDGVQWANNENWLNFADGVTPCQWYGVQCADNHVAGLALAQNGLSGRLPRALGRLDFLTRLDLSGNRLGPGIASGACLLGDTLIQADFGYNRLEPGSAGLRNCLTSMDPDWRATQTIAPRGLTLDNFAANAVSLSWTPIPYVGDGGVYQVSYSTSFNGDYIVHGTTADRSVAGYLLDDLEPGMSYFIRVRSVTPGHAEHPETLMSDPAWTIGVTRGTERILLAAVISADNNLSAYAPAILRRMRTGTALNPNVTVVVLADQRGQGDTRLLRMEGGQVTELDALAQVWGSDELDMADPDVLAWFLRYAREIVPAERTMVSLIGHGVGPTPDLAWLPPAPPDEPLPPPVDGIPPLPRGLEATPADVTDGSYLSTLDLAAALRAATDDGAAPFDILFFDQCFQGNLDVLYEVREAATLFIASPNYAWLVAPYAQYISQLAPAAENETIAATIINRYEANLNDSHPNAIFWARSQDIEQVAAAAGALGDALRAALGDGQAELVTRAVQNGRFVDTTQCGRGEFVLGPPDELIGAGSLAANLRQAFGEGDAYGVSAAAAQLLTGLSNLDSESRSGSPYLAPEQTWSYNDRITILAPLGRNLPGSVVWRASLYRDAAEQPAVWSPDPGQNVLVQGSFAFVQDYGWDEFINAWYGELEPTVGNWCHYTPPSIVLEAEGELMAFSGEVTPERDILLTWDAPEEVDPAAYYLYGRVPLGVDLELLATLPATAADTLLADPFPGQYDLRIVAVDENGNPLAQSGDIGIAVEWVMDLHLPLIAR